VKKSGFTPIKFCPAGSPRTALIDLPFYAKFNSMSEPTGELCFVLKTIPFRERDLVATLFSEKRGKFSAIARNGVSSRRFGGSLNLFTASIFEIDPKTTRLSEISNEVLVGLNSAQIKFTAEGLSKSFEKLSGASCLNELILKAIPEHRSIPELFKLYSNALIALQELPDDRAIAIVNAFILKITQWLGVQPSLTRCVACEKPLNEITGQRVYPQIAKGAWICENCYPATREEGLSKLVILDAYHSMLHSIRKIEFQASHEEHEQLLTFLERHLQYFVPGLDKAQLSTTRFLRRQDFLNG
jgi:DNA repair protein RecO (recombination protein O)